MLAESRRWARCATVVRTLGSLISWRRLAVTCPQCQHLKSRLLLERQLPGHHFLLTIAVPGPCGRPCAAMRASATPPCSKPPPRPSRPWGTAPAGRAANTPGSSECFTPGTEPFSILSLSTMGCQAALRPRSMALAMPRAPASSCRSRSHPGSFGLGLVTGRTRPKCSPKSPPRSGGSSEM